MEPCLLIYLSLLLMHRTRRYNDTPINTLIPLLILFPLPANNTPYQYIPLSPELTKDGNVDESSHLHCRLVCDLLSLSVITYTLSCKIIEHKQNHLISPHLTSPHFASLLHIVSFCPVGPFALYGSLLVSLCARYGTDYCDITGETDWVREMIDLHDETAKASGARIINSILRWSQSNHHFNPTLSLIVTHTAI